MHIRSVLRLMLLGVLICTTLFPAQANVEAEPLSVLRFQLVTVDGEALPNQQFVLRPYLSDAALQSRMLTKADLPVIGRGRTDATGSVEISLSTLSRGVAPVEAGYAIELKSRKWFVADTAGIAPQQEKVIVRADLIPVIFVPGIMGSFLDIGSTNYWPGLPKLPDKFPLEDTDNTAIRATDVIREIKGVSVVYTLLLNKLISAGYREYQRPSSDIEKWTAQQRCQEAERLIDAGQRAKKDTTLFTFGYDWRQSTRKSAEALKNLVNCVRRIHGGKVNLIGHSMGGLVIKQYILQGKSSADTVRSVTTFNTPYLGAVTAIKILATGDYGSVNFLMYRPQELSRFLQCAGLLGLNVIDLFKVYLCLDSIGSDPDFVKIATDRLKTFATKIPGAIELLPSNLYISETPDILKISGTTINTQEQYWNALANEFGDRAKQYRLEEQVGRDDLESVTTLTKDIDYLIQFSPNSASKLTQPTAARMTKRSNGEWVATPGTGDGTVNEFSLTRRKGGINWNPQSIPDHRTVHTIGYCNLGIDHSAIVQDDSALNAMIAFLGQEMFSSPSTYCVDGESVNESGSYNDAAIVNMQPADYQVPTATYWPELRWKRTSSIFDSSTVKAFYIEVKIDDGRPWSAASVYECVPIAADGTGLYERPSPAFMQANQGSFVWRVRASTEGMANKETCKAANRGQGAGWSTERHFSAFGLTVRSPASETAIGLPTRFEAEPLQQTWSRVVPYIQAAPYISVYRFRMQKSGWDAVTYCTTTPVVDQTTRPFNTLPVSFFRQMLGMSGLYTYQFEAVHPSSEVEAKKNCDSNRLLVLWRSYPRSIQFRIKPDLLGPVEGTTTTDGTWPQLQWQPAGNLGVVPYGYRIQVSRTRDFSRDIIVNECTRDTTYTPTNPGWMAARYGTLYWRVDYVTQSWTDKEACGRYNSYVADAQSLVRSFTSRPGIILTDPSTSYVSTTGKIPEVRWRDGAYGAATNGYRVQIASAVTPATTIVDECVRTSSYAPKDAWWSHAQMGNYTWRVNYVGASWSTQTQCLALPLDAELWSESRSFQNPKVNKSAVLIAPADRYTEPSGLWPRLEWNPAVAELGQYGYKVQVSTDRDFATTIVNECRTINSYIPSEDDWARRKTGTFYWRVNYLTKAWDGTKATCEPIYIHNAFWSVPRSFTTLVPNNPVALTSPASGSSTSNGLWPTLTWNNGQFMSAPFGYRVQVSSSLSFSTLDVDECRLSKDYVPKDAWWAAEKSGTFYWRIGYAPADWQNDQNKCKALSTSNGWSTPWSFTNPRVNIAPTLTEPANGGSNPAGLWPILRWTSPNAELSRYGYRVQVSKSNTFAVMIVDECRDSNSYEASTPEWTRQHNADQLFWRVNYVRSAWSDKAVCKTQLVSDKTWSTIGFFKNQQPHNPVTITAPNDGQNTSDGAWPQIQWVAGSYMPASYGYRIQVHTSSTFSGVLLVDECVAGTSYIPDNIWWMIRNRGRLFYRVNYANRAWTNKSDCKTQSTDSGLWSTTRSFVAGTSSAKPQQTSPLNGMTTTDGLWPALRWTPARNDLAQYGYRIQVSETSDFSELKVDECRTENVYTATDPGWTRTLTKTYYWRVSYANQAWGGNQPQCKSQAIIPELWSTVWRFTNPQPVNPVTFSEPSDGSVFSDGGWPRLRWSNGAAMDPYVKYGYRIQISNSSTFSTQYVDQCTNDTSYVPSDIWWMIDHGGTLYYRVGYENTNWNNNPNACDAFSQTDSRYLWSSPRRFTTNIYNAKPQSLSPANGDQTSDGKWKTLSWNPARGDLGQYGYRVQVSASSSFSSPIVDQCTAGNYYRANDSDWTRQFTNTLYWRVTYMKSNWSGETSSSCKDSAKINPNLWSTQYFVNPKPANPVVANSPSDGYSTSGGIWPTLRWSSGSNMSYYFPHGYRIVVWRANGSILVNECRRSTSYLPDSSSWMQSFREYLRWRIFYVQSDWSSQDACKAQNYDTNLGSPMRGFYNR